MLCAFQENATQYGGKRPVHTAFEVVNTGSQGVAVSTVGHPLKNPPFTGESDRGVWGYPSGAERIRTRLPLFPLPLLGAVIGKWAGSTFAAPGCVGVLAGRLPPTASSASAEAASAGTPAPKGAAPAEAAAGTSAAEGGPPAAEAAAKAAAGAGLGPGGRRPSAPEGAAGPPAGRGPAAPKGAAEGTARSCARTWPGAGAGRWPGSEAHTRAEAGAPGRAGGPGGPGTEDKEGTVDIAGPVPAAAVTAAAGALQSQQHHDHQHKNNNQVGQIAHGRASFPGQRYCFPYQSSRALVSSSTAPS